MLCDYSIKLKAIKMADTLPFNLITHHYKL